MTKDKHGTWNHRPLPRLECSSKLALAVSLSQMKTEIHVSLVFMFGLETRLGGGAVGEGVTKKVGGLSPDGVMHLWTYVLLVSLLFLPALNITSTFSQSYFLYLYSFQKINVEERRFEVFSVLYLHLRMNLFIQCHVPFMTFSYIIPQCLCLHSNPVLFPLNAVLFSLPKIIQRKVVKVNQ